MTHSAGAVRAAQRLLCHAFNMAVLKEIIPIERIAEIIDEETYTSDMQAFIYKVAEWDFDNHRNTISQAQTEATALIKKVRG